MTYIHPIVDSLQAMFGLFIANFLAGLIVDILINDGNFSFKKAWQCISEFSTFSIILACIWFVGERMDSEKATLTCVSIVMYALIYFYSCNILRNVRQLFREESTAYKLTNFLYYALSVEFVKKIPHLKNFKDETKRKREDTY